MSDLHLRALNSAKTYQAKYMYGNTRLKNNNSVGGETAMTTLQNDTLTNKSVSDRMKQKIIVRRDERVRQSMLLNSL